MSPNRSEVSEPKLSETSSFGTETLRNFKDSVPKLVHGGERCPVYAWGAVQYTREGPPSIRVGRGAGPVGKLTICTNLSRA
jgi:hypothetical protein